MSKTCGTAQIGHVHDAVTPLLLSLGTVIFMGHMGHPNTDIQGERFEAIERLVVAPAAGVFEPVAALAPGSHVSQGQVVGHLASGTERTPVVSPFAGRTGEHLAWAGERLVSHQPVMWLRAGTPGP